MKMIDYSYFGEDGRICEKKLHLGI